MHDARCGICYVRVLTHANILRIVCVRVGREVCVHAWRACLGMWCAYALEFGSVALERLAKGCEIRGNARVAKCRGRGMVFWSKKVRVTRGVIYERALHAR